MAEASTAIGAPSPDPRKRLADELEAEGLGPRQSEILADLAVTLDELRPLVAVAQAKAKVARLFPGVKGR